MEGDYRKKMWVVLFLDEIISYYCLNPAESGLGCFYIFLIPLSSLSL